jgi:hypothetical protein
MTAAPGVSGASTKYNSGRHAAGICFKLALRDTTLKSLIEPLDPITLQAEARPSIGAGRKSPARCGFHRLTDARVNNHNARSNANVPFAGSGEGAYGVIKKASENDGKVDQPPAKLPT